MLPEGHIYFLLCKSGLSPYDIDIDSVEERCGVRAIIDGILPPILIYLIGVCRALRIEFSGLFAIS